jgi:hypothetical protein
MEVKKLREQPVGAVTEKVVRVKRKKGKVTVNDIKNLREKFINDGENQFDVFKVPLIKVNAGKWVTFTSEEKFNEYFESKVKDPSKFYEFDEVHFYVHY